MKIDEKIALGPTKITSNFDEPCHRLGTKTIKDPDFPIYLLLSHLKKSYMPWWMNALYRRSCLTYLGHIHQLYYNTNKFDNNVRPKWHTISTHINDHKCFFFERFSNFARIRRLHNNNNNYKEAFVKSQIHVDIS